MGSKYIVPIMAGDNNTFVFHEMNSLLFGAFADELFLILL